MQDQHSRYRILLAGLFFAVLCSVASSPVLALERILLVRHAEKVEPWPAELETFQPLSEQGERRATALAGHLADRGLVAVLTSPTSRTVLTGMAVARELGVPLRTDPRTLEPAEYGELFDELRRRHARAGTVLIVGHSNTIPLLLRHLGATDECAEALGMSMHTHGDRALELIEGYDGVWTVELEEPGCAGLARHEHPLAQVTARSDVPEPRTVVLDADRLSQGQATYSMRYGREPMGVAKVELSREGEEIVFLQTLDLGRAGIRRRTESRHHLAGEGLRRVEVSGPMGPSEADVEVTFDDGRLSGHSDFPRSRNKPQGRLTVDRPAPEGLFEASALTYLVAAMPIDRVSDFNVVAYRPTDDQLTETRLRVGEPESLTVPAGSFEARPVDILDDGKGQRVWVGVEDPRRIVRIELLGQGWVYELVESESSTNQP